MGRIGRLALGFRGVAVVPADVEIYPLSLQRYERMVDEGILGPGDRVELIRGMLAAMAPHGARHAAALQWLSQVFIRGVDPARFDVRVQLPIRLPAAESVPEPDVAVVSAGAYATEHPTTADLVIEVSDSSLLSDLGTKADVYATGAIPELWVIDVARVTALVHRCPANGRYQQLSEETARLQPSTPGLPTVDLAALLARLD